MASFASTEAGGAASNGARAAQRGTGYFYLAVALGNAAWIAAGVVALNITQ